MPVTPERIGGWLARDGRPDQKTNNGEIMAVLSGLVLCVILLVAFWGMASLQASLIVSSRTEQAQEEMEANAALDAAIAYQPEPVRTIESLAEQVQQLELRLRALEMKVE